MSTDKSLGGESGKKSKAEPQGKDKAGHEAALDRWSGEGGASIAGPPTLGDSVEGTQPDMGADEWQRVSDETSDAHLALLKAVHRLESAVLQGLENPAERAWEDAIRRELRTLSGAFEAHSISSAPPSGLIGQVEVLSGHSQQVTAVLALHAKVPDLTRALLHTLTRAGPEERLLLARRGVAELSAALREHEARELDLIYETSTRVRGGEG